MAKLYYYYSAMNAGKSTVLLQSAHNYRERGMRVKLFTAAIDDRYKSGTITSRIGISAEATSFNSSTDMLELISKEHEQSMLGCILIDESQFLTK